MADNLRSSTTNTGNKVQASAEEKVLGDKAVGGIDDDKDHVPNVVSGLKGAISNPNTSTQAKNKAADKLDALGEK